MTSAGETPHPERPESFQSWVEIRFDCLPLRSIGEIRVPEDASPKFRAKCERIERAIRNHGRHNTYYLHNAVCAFHLTNRATEGLIEFSFEGTVFTNAEDDRTVHSDLDVQLVRETCDWLTEPVVEWFVESVRRAVAAEFDRFIEAGDLAKARQRLEALQAASDQSGGYLGMYL